MGYERLCTDAGCVLDDEDTHDFEKGLGLGELFVHLFDIFEERL